MVVVDTREPPYHAVMVKGDAEIGPALSRDEEYEIALRYLGPDRDRTRSCRNTDASGHDDSTIIIRPTRVIQYRGG